MLKDYFLLFILLTHIKTAPTTTYTKTELAKIATVRAAPLILKEYFHNLLCEAFRLYFFVKNAAITILSIINIVKRGVRFILLISEKPS
jgi:hypothetical protein